jgi:hypothetical protein
MAFLFQDQNQGIRNDAPRECAAAATVLFHPDFNRRLRNHTESADPSSKSKKALAGLGFVTLTAGGDFHPALRTSAARLSGHGNYDEAQARQQAPNPWEPRMSAMTAERDGEAAGSENVNDCGYRN